MSWAYSIELRARVVQAYEAGEGSYPVIARRFSVGEASVRRWVRLQRDQGHVAPRPRGGGTLSTISLVELAMMIARLRDPTAGELTAEYNRRRRGRGRIHVSSMKRALRRHGYVVKKNAEGRWSVCAPTSNSDGRSS